MWHCPKCNEALDDRCSTCWNCGTNAEVVELCSAADGVEAFAIADALEAAGIKASVVGDMLQATAAGGVPLGEASAPRIWVTREQEQKARELLAQFRADFEADAQRAADEQSDEETDTDAAEAVEEPAAEIRPRHDVSLLSLLLALAGIGAIVAGIHYGVTNGELLAHYSRSAEAVCVSAKRWSDGHFERMRLPVSEDPTIRDRAIHWRYSYTADGVPHAFEISSKVTPAQSMPIRYDPADPKDCRLEAILAPLWCVTFGVVLGVLLFFLAYQFR